MKKKAAIYARVSTSDGKQDYNRQVDDLKAIIREHGYKSNQIEVYAESLSGYKGSDSRPKLTELLQAVEADPTSYIIYTTEISRIGRNPTETRGVIDHLTVLGVPVYIQSLGQKTLDNDGKRNAIMSIILQVLIEYANMEAETFKARSKSGLLKSARDGKAGGSNNHPYGYRKDEKGYLVIDETEKPVIEEIFRLYKAGHGIKVISGILNERNIPTRTNKARADKTITYKYISKKGSEVIWSDKQIHDILKNTLYKGDRRFKGELLPAPSIVSKELFDECTDIMKGKTHRNYLTSYTYLLKDLCTCGFCNRNYFAKYKPVERGDKVYICSSRLKKNGNCGNIGVNITLIESTIYDQLISTDSILKYLNNNSEIKTNLINEIKRMESDLAIIKSTLKEKEKQKERLLDAWVSGYIKQRNEFEERNTKFETEIESATEKITLLTKNISNSKQAKANLDSIKATKQVLISAKVNREQLKAIFGQFVMGVIINKVDNNSAYATVAIGLNGTKIGNLFFLLDLNGVRRRPMKFRYKSTFYNLVEHWEDESDSLEDKFELVDWRDIPEEHLIVISL